MWFFIVFSFFGKTLALKSESETIPPTSQIGPKISPALLEEKPTPSCEPPAPFPTVNEDNNELPRKRYFKTLGLRYPIFRLSPRIIIKKPSK
ncbi:hypothetical protein GPJ56_003529 [Histomonas meleagridis]|uniref:uncharacterized protein n=1 Tax=Histomonas meleagridis TaxID=135588 RepID=UPI00355AA918|nr:hypothetical protein GPJ56_003529 [Histomonas meleagridis]KAH0806415.1 hypothetical protein GO595_000790 [Histomonas meleagridis]